MGAIGFDCHHSLDEIGKIVGDFPAERARPRVREYHGWPDLGEQSVQRGPRRCIDLVTGAVTVGCREL